VATSTSAYTQALFRAWWLGWWGFYKTEGQFQH
jgi:hypothetical protein